MNTLGIEKKLAEKYQYKKLPLDISMKYREFFRENIPDFLSVNGGGKLLTLKGSPICDRYDMIVIGDYGAFVEFSQPAAGASFIVAPGQEYRINDERYSKHVKYVWLTVNDGSNVKIYYQRHGVDYADYLPNKYYVSVHEVKGE